ncbi:MAG: hypothetical protein ACREUV_06415 [Burkholderiales bacterium]
MPGNFTSSTYREIAQLTEKAVEWLQEQGMRVENTRINKYLTDMKQLAEDFESQAISKLSSEKLVEYDERMRESMFEAADLIMIYKNLQGHVTDGFREKLQDLVKGPVSYPEERSNSNRPRNTAFELATAAYFAMSKLAPFLWGMLIFIPRYKEQKWWLSVNAPKTTLPLNRA